MKTPHIKTALPGPKAEAMLKRDSLVVSPSYPRDYPFVISHARARKRGMSTATASSTSWRASPCAHRAQPSEGRAGDHGGRGQVRAHLERLLARESDRARPRRSLRSIPVGEPAHELLLPERHRSGRRRAQARTLRQRARPLHRFSRRLPRPHDGLAAFTSSKYTQQTGFFPTMPGVTHVPYPNTYRPLFAGDDQGAAVLNYIENVLFRANVPPNEVAAILIEPMQGEGGYLVPPDGFLQGLRELCDRHGILLIFDEVQSGIGRTGKMFAAQHLGVAPDIMTLAKGLGSGLPIGMAVAKQASWSTGSAARTATRTAAIRCAARRRSRRSTSCRAEYCANAARVGEYFIGKLRELQQQLRMHRRCARQGPDARHGAGRGSHARKTPATQLTEKLHPAAPTRTACCCCRAA